MILVQIQQINTAETLLQSASNLATQLGKTFTVLSFADSDDLIETQKKVLNNLLPGASIIFRDSKSGILSSICEELEVSFLFIQLLEGKTKSIRAMLSDCRELRIPYLFYKDSFGALDLTKVILPIGFLEEELAKNQWQVADLQEKLESITRQFNSTKYDLDAIRSKALFKLFKACFRNLSKA